MYTVFTRMAGDSYCRPFWSQVSVLASLPPYTCDFNRMLCWSISFVDSMRTLYSVLVFLSLSVSLSLSLSVFVSVSVCLFLFSPSLSLSLCVFLVVVI